MLAALRVYNFSLLLLGVVDQGPWRLQPNAPPEGWQCNVSGGLPPLTLTITLTQPLPDFDSFCVASLGARLFFVQRVAVQVMSSDLAAFTSRCIGGYTQL